MAKQETASNTNFFIVPMQLEVVNERKTKASFTDILPWNKKKRYEYVTFHDIFPNIEDSTGDTVWKFWNRRESPKQTELHSYITARYDTGTNFPVCRMYEFKLNAKVFEVPIEVAYGDNLEEKKKAKALERFYTYDDGKGLKGNFQINKVYAFLYHTGMLYIAFGISYDEACSCELISECNCALASLYAPQKNISVVLKPGNTEDTANTENAENTVKFKNLFGDLSRKLAETIRIGIQVSVAGNEPKKVKEKTEIKLENSLVSDITDIVSKAFPGTDKENDAENKEAGLLEEKFLNNGQLTCAETGDLIKIGVHKYIQTKMNESAAKKKDGTAEEKLVDSIVKGVIKDGSEGPDRTKTDQLKDRLNNYFNDKKKSGIQKKIDKLIKKRDKFKSKNKSKVLDYNSMWGTPNDNKSIFPKKALVCNYNVLSECEKLDYALYHNAYAYNSKHDTLREEKNIIAQSGNVKWMISRQGIACVYSKGNGEGEAFLDKGMNDRVDQIYLWLYVLLLHMYHGVQYFNTEFVEIYEEAIKKKKTYHESLSIVKEMEVKGKTADSFYLQNIYTDVSDISHQNAVFRKMYEVYNIDQMLADYKENRDLCAKYLNEMLNDKVNSKINIVSYIAAFIALYNPIKDVTAFINNMDKTYDISAVVTLSLMGIFVIYKIICELIKRHR